MRIHPSLRSVPVSAPLNHTRIEHLFVLMSCARPRCTSWISGAITWKTPTHGVENAIPSVDRHKILQTTTSSGGVANFDHYILCFCLDDRPASAYRS